MECVKSIIICLLFLALSSCFTNGSRRPTSTFIKQTSALDKLSRSKRSPFIIAFQVTRPPGLFQLSMRKPVIMNVMSNMTSMMLGSELARMFGKSLSKGLSAAQLAVSANKTIV